MDNSCEKKLECYTGYLSKSPCRDCKLKKNLPACSDDCKILNQVQMDLVGIISCTNNFSELETFSLSYSQP
ncbi:MAG: hypothetical protein FP814_15140 [Desulfobacterium sp.]|nr:hypothetical protein [Desulfobacterium sp.]MBU3947514.1 hypothetical protein [Pseudomonadota bacterium]MBU4036876.1 hypothetical protein [Pseudomonadota bacterium]